MNIILHSLIGIAAICIVGPATYWYMEPFPFSDIKITTTGEEHDGALQMTVSMFVHNKECPYLIETEAFDSAGSAVSVEQKTFNKPPDMGSVDQGERLQAEAQVPGRGLLKARIGAMCNWAQVFWPRYSDWVEVEVHFMKDGER